MCRTNAGGSGSALIFAIAARSVAVTSVFAGLSKPMWLSLICTNRSAPSPFDIIEPCDCPSGDPFRMPLDIVQTAPVPTQAMHFRKCRRSWICLFCVFHSNLLRAQELCAPDHQLSEMAGQQGNPISPQPGRRPTAAGQAHRGDERDWKMNQQRVESTNECHLHWKTGRAGNLFLGIKQRRDGSPER